MASSEEIHVALIGCPLLLLDIILPHICTQSSSTHSSEDINFIANKLHLGALSPSGLDVRLSVEGFLEKLEGFSVDRHDRQLDLRSAIPAIAMLEKLMSLFLDYS